MSTKMQRMLGEELNPRLIEQEIRRQEIAADLKEGLIRENMLYLKTKLISFIFLY